MTYLSKEFKEKIAPNLAKELGYKNPMQIPNLSKIVINMGVGEAAADKKKIEKPYQEMMLISGQKPVICLSKKAIAAFKLRENMPIGCKVTLRKAKMYEFMYRFVNIVLPRVRDFKGLTDKGFDGNGNYSFSLKEQIVFPEIDYNNIDKIRGMNITFCTSAKNDKDAKMLLKAFNMPFISKN